MHKHKFSPPQRAVTPSVIQRKEKRTIVKEKQIQNENEEKNKK